MASLLDPNTGQVVTPDMLDNRRKLMQSMLAGPNRNYAQPGGAWMGIGDGLSKVAAAFGERNLEDQQAKAMGDASQSANAGLDSFFGGAQPSPTSPMAGAAPQTGPQVPGDTGMPNFMGGPGALAGAKPETASTVPPQVAPGGAPAPVPFPASNSPPGGKPYVTPQDLANPIVPQLGKIAQQYGIDPHAFVTAAKIESGIGQSPDNPASQYKGLYQVGTNEAQAWGIRNVHDPIDNATGTARGWVTEVKPQLEKLLGRPATWGEVYLAHQQGPAGAAALLTHPDMPVTSVVPYSHVVNNIPGSLAKAGMHPGNMTAGQFASIWLSPFASAPPASPPIGPQASAAPQGMIAAAQPPPGAVQSDTPPQNAQAPLQVTGQSQAQPQFGQGARANAAMSGTDTVGAQPFGPPGAPLPPQPPQQAPQAAPQGFPGPQGGPMGGQVNPQAIQALRPLMAALSNPWTPPGQVAVIQSLIAPYLKQLGPVDYQTINRPDGSVVAFNSRTGQTFDVAPATHHFIQADYGYGRRGLADEFNGQAAPGGGGAPGQGGASGDPISAGLQNGDLIQSPAGYQLTDQGKHKFGFLGADGRPEQAPVILDPKEGTFKVIETTQSKIDVAAGSRLDLPIEVHNKDGSTYVTTGRLIKSILEGGGNLAPGATLTQNGKPVDAASFTQGGQASAPPPLTGNATTDNENVARYFGNQDQATYNTSQTQLAPNGAAMGLKSVGAPEEMQKAGEAVASSAGSAAAQQQQLNFMRADLDQLNNKYGPNWAATGVSNAELTHLGAMVNGIATTFGVPSDQLPFDGKNLAAAADLSKQAFVRGTELAHVAGGREGAQVIFAGVKANPNGENVPEANNRVWANLMAANQQKADLANFFSLYGSVAPASGYQSAFRAFLYANPNEKYTQLAQQLFEQEQTKLVHAQHTPPVGSGAAGAAGATQAGANAPPPAAPDYTQAIQLLQQAKAAGAQDADLQAIAKSKNIPPQVLQQALGPAPTQGVPGTAANAMPVPQAAPPAAGTPAPSVQPAAAAQAPPAGPYGQPIAGRTADLGALTQGTPSANVPTPPRPFLQGDIGQPPAFDPAAARARAAQLFGSGPQYQFNSGAGNPVQGMNPTQQPTPQPTPPPPGPGLNLPHWQPNAPVPGPIPGAGINVQFPPNQQSAIGRGIDVQFGAPKPQTGPDQGTSVSPEAGQNTNTPSSATRTTPIRTVTQGAAAVKAGQNPTAVAKALLVGGIDPGRAAQALVLGGVPPEQAKSIVAAAQRTK